MSARQWIARMASAAAPVGEPKRAKSSPQPQRSSNALFWRSQTEIQRTPITKSAHPVTTFDFKQGKQVATDEGSTAFVDLAYDPETGVFTCTFTIMWEFPPGWPAKTRDEYRKSYIDTVVKAWSNRYLLVEYADASAKAKPTGRKASVQIAFSEITKPTSEERGKESYLDRRKRERAYELVVRNEDVRDSVRAGSLVTLDADSVKAESHGTARYRNYGKPDPTNLSDDNFEAYNNPPYGHYSKAGIKIGLPKQQSFSQVAAQHEFGHMIGLDDEYVLSKEDYNAAVTGRGLDPEHAKDLLQQRSNATGRIMNIGSSITPDAYHPFARWLSDLTGKTWRVKP